jgi:hypothetical protein
VGASIRHSDKRFALILFVVAFLAVALFAKARECFILVVQGAADLATLATAKEYRFFAFFADLVIHCFFCHKDPLGRSWCTYIVPEGCHTVVESSECNKAPKNP